MNRAVGCRHVILVVACTASCVGPSKRSPVIDGYRSAVCVPPSTTDSDGRRTWDHTLTMRGGGEFTIIGIQAPGGKVAVVYGPSRSQVVAADAGDYILPTDVRWDASQNLLFIKTDGAPAVGPERETWLFTYDVHERRPRARVRVDPDVLPPECS